MNKENILLQKGEGIKPIEGYEGLYSITSFGRVWSHKRFDSLGRRQGNKFLFPSKDNLGYLKVNLSKNNEQKRYRIHTIVARHFISNFKNLPEINHKDGNKLNNHITNLEWCSCQENSNHALTNNLLKKETSKYYGVVFSRTRDRKCKWMAYTKVCNKSKTIGYFKTELEAVRSRDKFIIDHGLNKPLNKVVFLNEDKL